MKWTLLWWHAWRSRVWFARAHYAESMHRWHQETSLAYEAVLREEKEA